MRNEDVSEKDGAWILQIMPEAGTIRRGFGRDVPIDSHLIGYCGLDFVSTPVPVP